MTTLYVVACSAKKSRILRSGEAMPAKEAYLGQAFRMARLVLERRRLKWCILSGHYGFIWPSTMIEDYDVKMKPVRPGDQWDECFGLLSNRQFARLRTADRVVVLGSRVYSDAAQVLLGRPVEAPLAGLMIGHMLQNSDHPLNGYESVPDRFPCSPCGWCPGPPAGMP